MGGLSFGRLWAAFSGWRRSRPFWAGLWCLLGGALIAYGPVTVLPFVLVSGTIVSIGILMGVIVLLMGLLLWVLPQNRHIAGLVAIAFSLVSFITSNLGGFIVGMVLGIVGGAMGFAWTPVRPAAGPSAPAAGERPRVGVWPPFGRR